MWTIVALCMTVLMGGIIAYNGDLIGRKYGKKRLSVFGLRPKHTAILITSITGVLISGSTTAAIFLLTPTVRRVILEGEQAIRDLPVLEGRTRRLAAETNRLESELAADRKNLDAVRRDLAERTQSLKVNTARLITVQTQKAAAEISLKAAVASRNAAEAKKAELYALVGHLRKQRNDLAAGNVELTDDNRRLSQLNDQLSERTTELSRSLTKKAEQNSELDSVNKEIARQNESLIRSNRALETQNGDLTQEKSRLLDDTSNLKKEVATLQKIQEANYEASRELTEKLARLRTAANQLEQDAALNITALYSTLEALRTRPVAVHAGEDLARITIPARSDNARVREYLRRLTREASDNARVKGSEPGERATTLAVQIVDRRTLARTPFGVREISITEDEQVNQVVGIVSESPVPVCVLAVAAGNSVKGEPAVIDLQPLADHLVYPRGRTVASKKFDVDRAPELIFMDLVQFVKDVGRTAVERGMIPRIDPATGEPQVGALDWPELVRLVERVRGAGGRVHVSAVAAGDTSASGPLRLEFKVENGGL